MCLPHRGWIERGSPQKDLPQSQPEQVAAFRSRKELLSTIGGKSGASKSFPECLRRNIGIGFGARMNPRNAIPGLDLIPHLRNLIKADGEVDLVIRFSTASSQGEAGPPYGVCINHLDDSRIRHFEFTNQGCGMNRGKISQQSSVATLTCHHILKLLQRTSVVEPVFELSSINGRHFLCEIESDLPQVRR